MLREVTQVNWRSKDSIGEGILREELGQTVHLMHAKPPVSSCLAPVQLKVLGMSSALIWRTGELKAWMLRAPYHTVQLIPMVDLANQLQDLI